MNRIAEAINSKRAPWFPKLRHFMACFLSSFCIWGFKNGSVNQSKMSCYENYVKQLILHQRVLIDVSTMFGNPDLSVSLMTSPA